MSFNLKTELLKLIHDDKDINKALCETSITCHCFISIVHVVECLVNKMLEKVTVHPDFLDIAMRKIGSGMQQDHVSSNSILTFLFTWRFVGDNDESS